MNIIREEYSFLKPNRAIGTILDVGANIGTASRYFWRRFPTAEIVAFEPSGDNISMLVKNTDHADIRCLHAGLWSKTTNLKIVDDSDWKYALRVVEDEEKGDIRALSIPEIMIQMEWDFIDLLKLDVEGSEVEILSKNLEQWSHKVGILLIELHPKIDIRCTGILFRAFAGRNFELAYKGENLVLIFKDVEQ